MLKFLRLSKNHFNPDPSQLSHAGFADWTLDVMAKQRKRDRQMMKLRLAGELVGTLAVVAAFLLLAGPVSTLFIAPPAIALLGWAAATAGKALKVGTCRETTLMDAELARRSRLPNPSASPAAPALFPQAADAFTAAAHKGVEEKMTVSRPLQLVKKPLAVLPGNAI